MNNVISKELVEELHQNELLWFLIAGLETVETYDNESDAIEIARQIISILPQTSIDAKEQSKMIAMLENTIDAFITDIQQGKY